MLCLIKFLKNYVHYTLKKKLKKIILKKIIFFYLNIITFNTNLLYKKELDSVFFNCFFFLTFPKKQLHYQLYLMVLDFHKNFSSGVFLKWNFNNLKFFKKNLKNIISIVILFWHYFLEFFQELGCIFIKTYNYYIFNFLNTFYTVFDTVPTALIVKKSYNNIFYKKRRIKKRVFKLLRGC